MDFVKTEIDKINELEKRSEMYSIEYLENKVEELKKEQEIIEKKEESLQKQKEILDKKMYDIGMMYEFKKGSKYNKDSTKKE